MKAPLPYVLRADVPSWSAREARRAALRAVVASVNLELPDGESIAVLERSLAVGGRYPHPVHRYAGECRACGGGGRVVRCMRHPWAACDCVAVEVACSECEGEGWREESDCDCPGCCEVAGALAMEAEHDGE